MAKKSNMSYGYDYDGTGNYSSTIRGGYTPFRLQNTFDTDAFGKVIENLNTRQRETAQQAARIAESINKVQLHSSEDAYKHDLVKKYTDAINKDPFNVTGAYKLGFEAAKDLELFAKARANEDYEKWKQNLEAARTNGRISKVTEERLLQDKNNQYRFTPKTDGNGNIVGGERWNPGEDYVATIDRTKIVEYAARLAAPHTEKKSTSTSHSGSKGGSSSSSTDQLTELTEEKIKDVMAGVFQQLPGAEESLRQDFKDDVYLLKKYKETLNNPNATQHELKIASDAIAEISKRVYKSDGTMRTPTEYMAYSMDLITPNMAIHDTVTDRSSSSQSYEGGGGGGTRGSSGGMIAPPGLNLDLPAGMDIFATTMSGTLYQNYNSASFGRVSSATTTLENMYSSNPIVDYNRPSLTPRVKTKGLGFTI